LRCKNKKTRVVVIEIIDLIIAESGPSVLGKQGIKEISSIFNLHTRETDVGVRNAALDFCFTLYVCVGRYRTTPSTLLVPLTHSFFLPLPSTLSSVLCPLSSSVFVCSDKSKLMKLLGEITEKAIPMVHHSPSLLSFPHLSLSLCVSLRLNIVSKKKSNLFPRQPHGSSSINLSTNPSL
jgi:hypothetical protein